MTRPSQRSIIALLVLLCIATRIPQLVSDKLLLDGDECVVAIMAKHMANGKDLSFYFYGQQYGFSFVECLFIIPFYWLFGVTAVAVKLGMLTLWTTGVMALYLVLRKISTAPPAFSVLIILLFICAPAWAVWSMKARGGYLTSFTASALLLGLLFRDNKKTVHYIMEGVLFALIYESQQLWLPGLIPFILYSLIRDKKPAHYLSFILSAGALIITLHFYKNTLPHFGELPMHMPTSQDIIPRLQHMPSMAYASLHGNYYFDSLQKPNLFCAVSAILFATAIVALLLVALYNIITRRTGWALFNCSVLSVLLTLSLSLFAHSRHGRYLLPLTGFTIISLTLLLNHLKYLRLARVALLTATTIGLVAVVTFYDFEFLTFKHKKLEATLQYLEHKGIAHVFCSDNMFTWQVLFYSNEKVIAREKRPPGRYPEYLSRVNAAFKKGLPTAYVSYPLDQPTQFPNPVFVNDFFIVINPPVDIINREFQVP